MPPLKPPLHVQQFALGYCLPACAEMALAQLGLEATQTQLARAFGTRAGVGTLFSRVERLKQWQVEVQIMEWGGVDRLTAALEAGRAVIVAVTTTPGLPGWGDIRTQHTLLVLSVNSDRVTYHDPALEQGPVFVPHGEFLLAWSEMSELAALLRQV